PEGSAGGVAPADANDGTSRLPLWDSRAAPKTCDRQGAFRAIRGGNRRNGADGKRLTCRNNLECACEKRPRRPALYPPARDDQRAGKPLLRAGAVVRRPRQRRERRG